LGQTTIRPTDLSLSITVPPGTNIVWTSVPMQIEGGTATWKGVPGPRTVFELRFRAPAPLRWLRDLSRAIGGCVLDASGDSVRQDEIESESCERRRATYSAPNPANSSAPTAAVGAATSVPVNADGDGGTVPVLGSTHGTTLGGYPDVHSSWDCAEAAPIGAATIITVNANVTNRRFIVE
jgi:hypothetical protein